MRTSRKLFVAAMVLALGITAAGGAAEPDKLMPADADIVAVLNVRQTLDSPIVKKYAFDMLKTAINSNVEVKTVLTAVGVDPFKDIDSVLVSSAGKVGKDGNIFMAVRGTFDPMKITAQAGKAGLRASLVQGLGIYEIKGAGEEIVFLTVIDNKTILASTKKEYLVKAATGGLKPSKNFNRLKASLARINGAPSLTLGMVISDEFKAQIKGALPGNEGGTEIIDKLESVSGSFSVNTEGEGNLIVNIADAKTAESLAGMIKLILPPKDENAKVEGVQGIGNYILSNGHIQNDKNAVVFTVKIPDEVFKKAFEAK